MYRYIDICVCGYVCSLEYNETYNESRLGVGRNQ